MIHNHLSFWGRGLSEYKEMFNLKFEPGLKILSVADGPSTFNLEARAQQIEVCSVDPVYSLAQEEIQSYFDDSYAYNENLFKNNPSAFIFKNDEEINKHLEKRRNTFNDFFQDYKSNPTCYFGSKLPELAGIISNYDLCLCSNLLFIFDHLFDLDFHVKSINKMLCLANEVRIFPLYNVHGKISKHLSSVIEILEKNNNVFTEKVKYEIYKGGNKMLKVTKR